METQMTDHQVSHLFPMLVISYLAVIRYKKHLKFKVNKNKSRKREIRLLI